METVNLHKNIHDEALVISGALKCSVCPFATAQLQAYQHHMCVHKKHKRENQDFAVSCALKHY